MLNEAQIAEIKARAEKDRRILEGTDWISEAVIGASRDRDALIADRDEMVRRLAKVREQAMSWIMGREAEHHVDDCSAAPVPAAPVEDAL